MIYITTLLFQIKKNYLLSSKNKILISSDNITESNASEVYNYLYEIKQLLFSNLYTNLIIIVSNVIKDIECLNINTKKRIMDIFKKKMMLNVVLVEINS